MWKCTVLVEQILGSVSSVLVAAIMSWKWDIINVLVHILVFGPSTGTDVFRRGRMNFIITKTDFISDDSLVGLLEWKEAVICFAKEHS